MLATIEAEPLTQPTIMRHVHEGGLEMVERRVEGRPALCVWWSTEHAEETTRESHPPEEGWVAIEKDHEGLAEVFSLLRMVGTMELVYLEPCPEDPSLEGVFEPERFIAMLESSLDE